MLLSFRPLYADPRLVSVLGPQLRAATLADLRRSHLPKLNAVAQTIPAAFSVGAVPCLGLLLGLKLGAVFGTCPQLVLILKPFLSLKLILRHQRVTCLQ